MEAICKECLYFKKYTDDPIRLASNLPSTICMRPIKRYFSPVMGHCVQKAGTDCWKERKDVFSIFGIVFGKERCGKKGKFFTSKMSKDKSWPTSNITP